MPSQDHIAWFIISLGALTLGLIVGVTLMAHVCGAA